MEFYILGVIAFVFGLAFKSLALRCGWVRERDERGGKGWLVLFLIVAVSVYFFNIVLAPLINTLLLEFGLQGQDAADCSWTSTLVIVVSLCGVMGWVLQFGHRAPPNFNPYADESAHPFGTDAPDTGIDIHADDNADPKRP